VTRAKKQTNCSRSVVYSSGSQTFMGRGPLGEYLLYRDPWLMQYHGHGT